MPRIARMIVKDEPTVYHVMSRTALDGFVLGDVEKEFLFDLIKRLTTIYFAEALGFCIMGNHFHLLVRMHTGDDYNDEEIRKRFILYFGKDKIWELDEGQLSFFREKWRSLAEYVKEIKQTFSRYYNKLHSRKGFFWSERFKSLIVDNGDTLINCLAYIDLNPIRAGMVKLPEEYRWCSLGYHVQTNNRDGFLSLDFGLREFGVKNERDRLKYYRQFVYERGKIAGIDTEREKDFELNDIGRFRYRTRYFADSGIIGSKAFVDRLYLKFKTHFSSKREKRPKTIRGLSGVYSLKRLSKAI